MCSRAPGIAKRIGVFTICSSIDNECVVKRCVLFDVFEGSFGFENPWDQHLEKDRCVECEYTKDRSAKKTSVCSDVLG